MGIMTIYIQELMIPQIYERMKDHLSLNIPIRINPYPYRISSIEKFLIFKEQILDNYPFVVDVSPIMDGHTLSSLPPIELLITFDGEL
jgi:hypothetical protein